MARPEELNLHPEISEDFFGKPPSMLGVFGPDNWWSDRESNPELLRAKQR